MSAGLLSNNRLIGSRHKRIDASSKVQGATIYAADFTLPGMLHGRVFRSTQAHARIIRLDTSKAQAVAGVRAIVSAKTMKLNSYGNFIKDFEVFADGEVKYVGQAIAAVAADTEAIAEAALGLIEIEYQPLPAVFELTEAIKEGAPLVHPDVKNLKGHPLATPEGNQSSVTVIKAGDVEQGFKDSYRVYEHTFRTAPVHAGYTEPRVAVGQWTPDGDATVWSNAQLLFDTQSSLAEIFGISPGKVRVIVPAIGGGFGGKLRIGMEHFALALAHAARRPVRVMSTSHEELSAALFRQPAHIWLKTGVDKEGRIIAKQGRLLVDTGAASGSGPLIASTGVTLLAGPYKLPNLLIEGRSIYTNNHPTGSVRAPSGPMSNFASESQMDIIAHDLGIDPLEIRLRNIIHEGDLSPTGQVMTQVGLEECLLKAAEAIGWDKRNPEKNRGKGLACAAWMTSRGSSGAYLKLSSGGVFTLMVGVVELGTGALTGVAQILAEDLGVDVSDITVVSADSQTTPYDFGSQGSRTMVTVANAARMAGENLMKKLRPMAAKALGVAEVDLELGGKGFSANGKKVTYAELAATANMGGGGLTAEANYIADAVAHDPARVSKHYSPAWPAASFHVHAADVSVDEMSGAITINRYVVAQDVGYAINPSNLEGQLEGGAVQGIGQAIFEELVIVDGHVMNANMTDYKMPTSMDVPPIEVILVTHPATSTPYGAKGVGEPPTIQPPAAIANAVFNATGKRIMSLPITAEKILLHD
ncbi:MAG: xanthine dehydrogenase family protein molybdopterin-binding subunit [Ferrovibrio sp.]|nr:xanthine dehydrogenase family protein molybdopterin-binding subunit [Ferrovibrio sp.]